MRLTEIRRSFLENREAEIAKLRAALERIRSLPLGADTGSAQWQINCAVTIATEALE